MKKTRLFVALAAVIGFSVASQAQMKPNSIFTTGKTELISTQQNQAGAQIKNDRLMITHSTSQDVVAGTVGCVDQTTGYTAENHYIRSFNMLTEFGISGNFYVSDIEFGVESATSGTGTGQPVSVKLYTLNGAMTFANMTLIGQKDTLIPDMSLAHFMVPVNATVGHGQTLIVDIFIPDGQNDSHVFFLGSNSLGQSAPSYLASDDCGVPNPVTYASIGFGTIHLVINVYGDVSTGMEEMSATQMQAWPNPANEKLHISLSQGNWDIQLVNISGKVVMQSEVSGETTLATDKLPKGMYLLRATNGSSSLQEKIIIR